MWVLLLAMSVILLIAAAPPVLADPASEQQLQALAGQGDANAQWMLGQALLTGNLGTTDEAEAVRWLQLAADQGHVLAQRDMGMLYELGLVFPRQSAGQRARQVAARYPGGNADARSARSHCGSPERLAAEQVDVADRTCSVSPATSGERGPC
jgi:TPR repeat protein